MSTIKAILIDDELDSLENLENKLTNFCNEVTVVATCQIPEEAVKLFELHKPDVVFLDIEMHRMSGFKLLETIENIDFEIVFVTAYNHYAIDAIRINVFDYLTKPISISDLQACVKRLLQVIAQKKGEKTKPFATKEVNANHPNKIAIPTLDGLEFIDITTILCIEAQSSYSKIFLNTQKEILVSKPLGEFEEVLSPFNFFRPHNSFLINMACIQKYSKSDGGFVILTNGKKVEISRRKKDDFLKQLITVRV